MNWLLLLLPSWAVASSILYNELEPESVNTTFQVYPFLQATRDFQLSNVVVTVYPDKSDVRDLCEYRQTIARVEAPAFLASSSVHHALYVKIVAGCYPSVMAQVVAKSNFSILIVRDKYYPAGLAAQSLWNFGEEFPIPVVQIYKDDANTFKNGTVLYLDAGISYYRSSTFLAYAVPLDVLFGVFCILQVFLSADRIYSHLKATKNKLTASVQVLIFELIEGFTKLTMGVIDPFGFFHILPTPWWRLIVFVGSSVTILTTFMLAFRMHAAVREAESRPVLTWWKYLVVFSIPLAMVAADLYTSIEYGSNTDNAGYWAAVSASLYVVSMTVAGFYFGYTKINVLNQLKSNLVKNDKRGLRRMGYFLALSSISMSLTIISSIAYVIAIIVTQNGIAVFISTILSATFVTLTGILHILALRRYSTQKEVDDPRFRGVSYARRKSMVVSQIAVTNFG